MLIYDASVESELMDITGVIRMVDCQHLWDLDVNGNLIHSIWWQAAYDNAALGLDITLGIEPDIHPIDPHPTDPYFAPLSDIRITHRILAPELVGLCKIARRTGSRVWTYRIFSPTYARFEHIVNNPTNWQQNVRDLNRLEYEPGKRLIDEVVSTGGGELAECYVGNAHNGANAYLTAKHCLLIERQLGLLESLGVPALPLLHPKTVTVQADIRNDIWESMIDTAGQRGRVVIWNGPIAAFPAISVSNHDIVESFV